MVRNRFFVALLFVPAAAFHAQSFTVEKKPDFVDVPINVQPLATIDENLFLIRNIEHVMLGWKGPQTPSDELRSWLYATRKSLSELKTLAELDHRDPAIIECHTIVLALLDDYRAFLGEADLVNFIGQVGSKEAETNSGKEAIDGAASMGQIGAIAGSLFGPPGTVIGGLGGALVGGVGRFVGSLDAYRNELRMKSTIDSAKRDYIVKRTHELESRYESAYSKIRIIAKRLASPKRFKWGDRIGFDEEAFHADELLSRRPDDPFLRVDLAVHDRTRPIEKRIELCIEAARLVPNDEDPKVDVYDNYRAAFLLAGAKLAALEGVYGTYKNRFLAGQSVKCFDAAASVVSKSLPFHAREINADACVVLDSLARAEKEYQQLFEAKFKRSSMAYKLCTVNSQLGNPDRALTFLRESIDKPQWLPQIPSDPSLKTLVAKYPTEVDRLCRPLLGKWRNKIINSNTMEFFANGNFNEIAVLNSGSGSFSFTGPLTLRLRTPGMIYGSNEVDLELEFNGNEMAMYILSNGNKMLFRQYERVTIPGNSSPTAVGGWDLPGASNSSTNSAGGWDFPEN